MSDASDQVSEQARFAAREFLAQWTRESGETLPEAVADRVLFAAEIGYSKGYADGFRAAYEEAMTKLLAQGER